MLRVCGDVLGPPGPAPTPSLPSGIPITGAPVVGPHGRPMLWVPLAPPVEEHSYASLVQRAAAWAVMRGGGWRPGEVEEVAVALAGTGARHDGLMRLATEQAMANVQGTRSKKEVAQAAQALLDACKAVHSPQQGLEQFVKQLSG